MEEIGDLFLRLCRTMDGLEGFMGTSHLAFFISGTRYYMLVAGEDDLPAARGFIEEIAPGAWEVAYMEGEEMIFELHLTGRHSCEDLWHAFDQYRRTFRAEC